MLGGYGFLANRRVPLLGYADLGFHELGHLLMYVFPVHDILTAAMGSIMQNAIPAGLAVYFWAFRHDRVAGTACAAWIATNLRDVSVYVADAPYERLELLGGEHDWAFILGPQGFDRLSSSAGLAGVLRGSGLAIMLTTLGYCVWELLSDTPERRTDLDMGSPSRPPSREGDLLPHARASYSDV